MKCPFRVRVGGKEEMAAEPWIPEREREREREGDLRHALRFSHATWNEFALKDVAVT